MKYDVILGVAVLLLIFYLHFKRDYKYSHPFNTLINEKLVVANCFDVYKLGYLNVIYTHLVWKKRKKKKD